MWLPSPRKGPAGVARGSGQRGHPWCAPGTPRREARGNGVTKGKATLPGASQEGSYKRHTAKGFAGELGTLTGLLRPERCSGTADRDILCAGTEGLSLSLFSKFCFPLRSVQSPLLNRLPPDTVLDTCGKIWRGIPNKASDIQLFSRQELLKREREGK